MSRVSWDLLYKRATSITEVSYLETIFMRRRRFRPNFHVESFLRSTIQESHINHRSELSGDHFHEWAMILSKISCPEFFSDLRNFHVESFSRSIIQESHINSQKWAIWRPFSWEGDDFVQIFMSRVSWGLQYKRATSIHRSELSGDHFHEWAMILSKIFMSRVFLEIYKYKESHINSQMWAIWRPFSWVGDDFVQIFMSRVFFRSIVQKSHINHRSEHIWRPFSWVGDWFRPNFHVESLLRSMVQESHINHRSVHFWIPFSWVGDWFRPSFHNESFLRSIIQESHINHRSVLSGDHFHEWAMILSKFSCREFLEIYYTREPYQFTEVTYLETIFMSGRWFSSNFSCREFLEIYNTREPYNSQKWAIWRPYFMSGRWFPPNFHVESFFEISNTKRATSIHRSELSGDYFHEWAMISSKFSCREFFSRSIVQESHINHRIDLSGDYFHEWATILSNFSCREFLEIYNTREPHHSQKWAIWRPFSWEGDDFVQIFMSRVSWGLQYKRATSITEVSYLETIFDEWAMILSKISCPEFFSRSIIQESHINSQMWAIWRTFSWVGDDFVQIFMSRVFFRSIVQKSHINHRSEHIWRPFSWVGDWFRPNFHVESLLRSIMVQESHINHRSDISGYHFHEWAIGFVQFFITRVSWDL